MTGEVELDGKTLVLRRIHARYHLQVDDDADRDAIDRVLGFHADRCPVARSIRGAIDVTTSLELEELGAERTAGTDAHGGPAPAG